MYRQPPDRPQQFDPLRPPPLSGIPPPMPLHMSSQVINNFPAQNMTSNIPPPSPTQVSQVSDVMEESNPNLPDPPAVHRIWEGKVWALEVVQQPVRARMCGFGDKDRRPISPPPCVRLIIFDPETGKEIDYSKVTELSRLVLNVDLWSQHGDREDNCVRHNNASPSIGTTSLSAYPQVVAPMTQTQAPQIYTGHNVPYSSPGLISPNPITPGSTSSYFPNEEPHSYAGPSFSNRPPSFSTDRSTDRFGAPYSNGFGEQYGSRANSSTQIQTPGAIRSTRSSQDLTQRNSDMAGQHIAKNLIGSASSSAFRLEFPEKSKNWGLWFVLQDLSVRTEGTFRLKMNLYNLSAINLTDAENKGPGQSPDLLVEAPCLASVFSKPFKVWSAKKFPGVIESTPLSKCFAAQGIKIPIRKDGKDGNPRKRKGVGSDEDEDGQEYGDDDNGEGF